MVYNAEDCRKKRPQVLAGELELPVQELWPIIYDVTCSVRRWDEGDFADKLRGDALGVFRIMLQKLDWDEDDEVDIFYDAIYEIPGMGISPDKIFEILTEANINFTEPMYRRGELTNVRDYLLDKRFSTELLEAMAKAGVDLNTAVIKGRTPVYILAKSFSLDRTDDEPDEDETALAKAVEEYFSVESMEEINSYGTSAAHEIVDGNHFLALEAMLKKGVNVNIAEDAQGEAGNTLLHVACKNCFPKIVSMLMEAGADDTIMNVNEQTPAHVAVTERGGAYGVTPDDMADTLRELKNIDIPGKDGMTPLMLAQDYELRASDELTPVLIEMGADVNRADNEGNTAALLHARWHCDKDVIKAMVSAGYNINARNADGNTLLHFAVKNRANQVAIYLLKKGADYNITNEEQASPLQLAVEKGLDDVLPFMGL